MKINNRKNTGIAMCMLSLILLFDMACLLFAEKIRGIDHKILYAFFWLVFGLATWRIIILKEFSMEVSEHIISVKYAHPFSKTNRPVLEIPLQKVSSYRLEKGFFNSFLVINVQTKKGVRSFYYRLGILFPRQAGKFKSIVNALKSYKTNDSGL